MFIICRRNTEVKEVQIFFKFPLLCLLNCCTGGHAEVSHEDRSLTEVANGQWFYFLLITENQLSIIWKCSVMCPENTYYHCDSLQNSTVQCSTKRSKCGRSSTQVNVVQQQQEQYLSLVFDHTSNERIKESSACTVIIDMSRMYVWSTTHHILNKNQTNRGCPDNKHNLVRIETIIYNAESHFVEHVVVDS